MSGRGISDTRLRSSVDPVVFHRKLSRCLGCNPRRGAELGGIEFPDLQHLTAEEFRDQYLLKEILRKYPGDLSNQDRRDPSLVALENFNVQEVTNKETNERLSSLPVGVEPHVLEAFSLAGRKVRSVLGEFSSSLFVEGLRFGPGATTRLSAQAANLVRKLTGKPHVTSELRRMAYLVLTQSPYWAYEISPSVSPDDVLAICEYDVVTTVPKNAETDRVIAKQPDMNLMIQLATAYVMRSRLARAGINLNDQTVNQQRALEASRSGKNATVDLKNASSSMCSELVWRMVGDCPLSQGAAGDTWYRLLDMSRTKYYRLPDGSIRRYELFSQMGNGYTFELESLIFWALASAVCSVLGIVEDVTVYGDDLIVPVESVPLLEKVLAYAGLTMNLDKTFFQHEGNIFRESCGKHYFNGIDVTPVYVRETLDTIEAVILLANNLKRWAFNGEWGLDARIKPVYDWVISHLPNRALKTAIPFGDDDDGLIKDWDEAHCPLAYSRGIGKVFRFDSPEGLNLLTLPVRLPPQYDGVKCRTFKVVSRGKLPSGREGLLVWHYGKSYKQHKEQPVSLKDKIDQRFPVYEPYRLPTLKVERRYGTRVVPRWNNHGPWMSTEELALHRHFVKVFYLHIAGFTK